MNDRFGFDGSRRAWLQSASCGFGALAFSHLAALEATASGPTNPLAPKAPHHTPKAKRIIFLFMQGGVSQVDSFDRKPLLDRHNGKQMSFTDSRTAANTGDRKPTHQRVMKSPWTFRQYGESGRWVSDLFPETGKLVDDLCLIHSVHTEGVAHGPATLFLHCGSTNMLRPSFGSWTIYGLGSENQNLPGFVSIAPSGGNGGARNYGSAFLPSVYQGTGLGRAGMPAGDAQIRNIKGPQTPEERSEMLELFRNLSAAQARRVPHDPNIDAVVNSFELASRMQLHAPEVMDISKESAATRRLYGIGNKETDQFGQQCLMARRLSEAGVRFVQLTYGDNTANPAWDQHSNLPKHAEHARAVDQPIAGLLTDLKSRGLLKDTIVWWGGEFGRTPYAEKNGTGRDHNPTGFTVWLAGGGVKSGTSHGATDEYGHHAVENKVHLHDLHATLLHLLGLNHERLTYRYAGRDFRLTDVAGRVVHEVIA
jgi:hypothetical protein